jgi:hypothetical protein
LDRGEELGIEAMCLQYAFQRSKDAGVVVQDDLCLRLAIVESHAAPRTTLKAPNRRDRTLTKRKNSGVRPWDFNAASSPPLPASLVVDKAA